MIYLLSIVFTYLLLLTTAAVSDILSKEGSIDVMKCQLVNLLQHRIWKGENGDQIMR